MNKNELVHALTEKVRETGEFKVTIKESIAYVDAMKEAIQEALKNGEEVSLPGLFKIDIVESKARMGHNPRTGEPVPIPARNKVRFKAFTALKDAVQK